MCSLAGSSQHRPADSNWARKTCSIFTVERWQPKMNHPQVTEHKSSIVRRPSSNYINTIGAIVWKDLAAELRSRELLSAMLVFALLVILIFNFALELDASTRKVATSGILWATFAFAGTLGLNRSMAVEKDRGCLDGLLLAPVDRSA